MTVIFYGHLTESVDPVVDFTVDPSKTVWIDSAPCLPRRPNPTLHWVRNVRTWPSNILSRLGVMESPGNIVR